ncbi:PepSY-associated TM helix [Symmachiella dynata]|uniref:PepSY-associated TM helix domain-containing protein n=1 Tax=Symmachiella dynata TaxID=2527995 RepID=UPI00118C767B|nr:PepSY domain-containing protein [Symmachiella dynata]QDT49137.1 PepSY-associated TM helix [Symmachiella dynata]
MTDTSLDAHDVQHDGSAQDSPQLEAPALEREGNSQNDAAASPKPAASGNLYANVWRWHFYAGLLTAPILWIVTITGALYVFRTELTELRDHDLLRVTPAEQRMSYEELKQVAVTAHGSSDLEALIVYPDNTRSIQFVGHHGEEGEHGPEEHKLIHIDPYSGTLLGTQIAEHDFFHIVLELHRNLLLGTTGRFVTELTTCWGIILLATGVFLWWPRSKKNVGVWVPRVRGKLYAILRDWHAVTGIYVVPLLLIVTATGLFFSPLMGNAFNTTAKKAGHWPIKEWFIPPQSKPVAEGTPVATLDEIVPTFLAQSRPNDAVRIRFAESPEHAHRAFLIQDEDKNSYRSVDVDQYTGELLKVVDGSDLKFLYRVRLWAVSIHMGQIFGTPTKILALIAAVVMLALSISGLWMWWMRKPSGLTGFPRRPARSLPNWGWGIVVLCALVLPVAGISIILVGIFDQLWGRFYNAPPPTT